VLFRVAASPPRARAPSSRIASNQLTCKEYILPRGASAGRLRAPSSPTGGERPVAPGDVHWRLPIGRCPALAIHPKVVASTKTTVKDAFRVRGPEANFARKRKE